jgi:phage shock protein PspC (stress-responsive transcriptional regulator)
MNKVVNINLNGIVFNVDESAYEQLKKYLDGLKTYFRGQDGAAEIIQDIEARIAELLLEKRVDKNTVITSTDIAELIAIMGEPGQIDADLSDKEKTTFAEQPKQGVTQLRRDPNHKTIGGVCAGIANYFGIDMMIPRILFLVTFLMFGTGILVYIIMWIVIPEGGKDETTTQTQVKRLFRDSENSRVGGVCAGIAEYVSIDAVWLRLGFLIALFVFGTGFLAYIILWIAIPQAKTSAEKLQMRGNPVDVSNIEKVVKNNIGKQSTTSKSTNVLTEIVRIFFKITSKLIGSLLLLLSIVLLGCVLFLWNNSFIEILEKLDITSIYGYFEYGFGLFCFSVATLIFVIGLKFLFHTRIKIGILSLVLTFTSLIGLGLMLYFGLQYRNSVARKSTVKEVVARTIAPDTLYINSDIAYGEEEDEDHDISVSINQNIESRRFKVSGSVDDWVKVFYNTRLSIKPSQNDSLQLVLVKNARGSSEENAQQNAHDIAFKSELKGNVLTIDGGIHLDQTKSFKYQQVMVKLRVPIGTIVKVDKAVMKMINKEYEEDFDLGETFKMTSKGLRCLDCLDTEDDDEEKLNIEWNVDDDDGEVNIKIRKDEKEKVADTTASDNGPK